MCLWNLRDPLKSGGTFRVLYRSRGAAAEVSFPFIEGFIPKAVCFWTSECSAGVPPASVGRSMAGETPALQKSNRKSIFLQTLVSLWRGLYRAILADHQVSLPMRIPNLDEPRHLGIFIGPVRFLGKGCGQVVDDGAVFFGSACKLPPDRRALPSTLGESQFLFGFFKPPALLRHGPECGAAWDLRPTFAGITTESRPKISQVVHANNALRSGADFFYRGKSQRHQNCQNRNDSEYFKNGKGPGI